MPSYAHPYSEGKVPVLLLYSPSTLTSNPRLSLQGVIFYAFFISIRHLRTAGKQRGPFIWQVKGASSSHKGSCFCSAVDDSCWCGPSLGVDTILEYSEKENEPVTALVFIKRKDGRGMSCVGGFVQLGEFEFGRREEREGKRRGIWTGRRGAERRFSGLERGRRRCGSLLGDFLSLLPSLSSLPPAPPLQSPPQAKPWRKPLTAKSKKRSALPHSTPSVCLACTATLNATIGDTPPVLYLWGRCTENSKRGMTPRSCL